MRLSVLLFLCVCFLPQCAPRQPSPPILWPPGHELAPWITPEQRLELLNRFFETG